MSRISTAPEGFRIETRGRLILIARETEWASLRSAGLESAQGWDRRLGASGACLGRGSTATLDLESGLRLRLKQLRRGGVPARLWHERFVGPRRLTDNLRIPLVALLRGVATPPPVALLVAEGPSGLYRGWLATEEILGATDLASRFKGQTQPRAVELESAMLAVRRMHDAGVDHRDLNLGNLLVRRDDDETIAAWVCDLDRARIAEAPLGFSRRQRALRRLERSYVKSCAPETADAQVRDGFYQLYSGGDEPLASRLQQGRAAGRGWILLHRLGWRR